PLVPTLRVGTQFSTLRVDLKPIILYHWQTNILTNKDINIRKCRQGIKYVIPNLIGNPGCFHSWIPTYAGMTGG
ncbi:MAG: hypothetical protein JXA92_00150, partial [candidate division Zixibacteria bacterium]|nr:hypothetical protein [candidate division Zixibacteria bacterium]